MNYDRYEIDNCLDNIYDSIDNIKIYASFLLAIASYIYTAKSGENLNYLYVWAGLDSACIFKNVENIYDEYNKRNELIKKLTL